MKNKECCKLKRFGRTKEEKILEAAKVKTAETISCPNCNSTLATSYISTNTVFESNSCNAEENMGKHPIFKCDNCNKYYAFISQEVKFDSINDAYYIDKPVDGEKPKKKPAKYRYIALVPDISNDTIRDIIDDNICNYHIITQNYLVDCKIVIKITIPENMELQLHRKKNCRYYTSREEIKISELDPRVMIYNNKKRKWDIKDELLK